MQQATMHTRRLPALLLSVVLAAPAWADDFLVAIDTPDSRSRAASLSCLTKTTAMKVMNEENQNVRNILFAPVNRLGWHDDQTGGSLNLGKHITVDIFPANHIANNPSDGRFDTFHVYQRIKKTKAREQETRNDPADYHFTALEPGKHECLFATSVERNYASSKSSLIGYTAGNRPIYLYMTKSD